MSAAVWKSGSKSITLPAGTYIIIAHGEMPVGNYTAYLAIDGIDIWEQCISFPVTSNDYRRATVSVFHHFTQQKTLKAKFLSQQAVTAINCEICAVRIK